MSLPITLVPPALSQEGSVLRELLPRASSFPGSCLAGETPDLRVIVKICDVWKGKHFFRKHLCTKASDWHFRIPELSLNSSELQGGQIMPWWEGSPELKLGELGWRKGFAVISANIRGFRFQLLRLGRTEVNPLPCSFPRSTTPGSWEREIDFPTFDLCGDQLQGKHWESSPGSCASAALDLSWPAFSHVNNSELTKDTQFSDLIGIPKSCRVTLLAPAEVGKHQGREKGAGCWNFQAPSQALHTKAAMIKLSFQITTTLRNAVIPGNCLSTWIPVWMFPCCRGEYQL